MVPIKGLIIRNTHLKYQSSSTHCSKVISKVKNFERQVKLQGQGHMQKKMWQIYTQKGLATGNTHVKYQSSSTYCSKVISNVNKFFKKQVKLQGQGHSGKIKVPTQRSYHKEYSCEISKLQHSLFKSYQQGLSFQKSRSNSKVKVTVAKIRYPRKGLIIRNTLVSMEMNNIYFYMNPSLKRELKFG